MWLCVFGVLCGDCRCAHRLR